ncbi:MAG: tRNA modification GTPase [Pirellulaceae bacterium]
MMTGMVAFDVNDSIAAIASPPGAAARGVIRLSGPSIDAALDQCFHSVEGQTLAGQQQSIVLAGQLRLDDWSTSSLHIQLYYWPTTASYTRQRSAEIHVAGSPPLLDAIMQQLGQLGVRQAQPGEFTMRAFLAGRIDLTRAEAVLGVIDSRSDAEMSVALRQLSGGLSGPLADLQDELLETVAHVEAGLDFVEDDIEFIERDQIASAIERGLQVLDQIIDQIDKRQMASTKRRVALVGRPNAGKSSLQNVLAGKSSAIVSSRPGTTRDYLTCDIDIGGYQVELVDTAGTMRQMEQVAARAGEIEIQKQAELQADQVVTDAHLRVLCLDGSRGLEEWERQQIGELAVDPPVLVVRTKSDLPLAWDHPSVLSVSSVDGAGLTALRGEIARRLDAEGAPGSLVIAATANRCLESLLRARDELRLAAGYQRSRAGEEVVAAALRTTLDELAVVTGKVFTDDILDRVFSRFCIGK